MCGWEPTVSDAELVRWRRDCAYEQQAMEQPATEQHATEQHARGIPTTDAPHAAATAATVGLESTTATSTRDPADPAAPATFRASAPAPRHPGSISHPRPSVALCGPSHPSVALLWEALARASETQRAHVWRFATGDNAPPRPWPITTISHTKPVTISGGGGDTGVAARGTPVPPFALGLLPPAVARSGSGSGTHDTNVGGASGSASGGGGLFSASTCARLLRLPAEPFDGGLPALAASLAESVALGLFNGQASGQANGHDDSGAAEATGNDGGGDFEASQTRLVASVRAAAAAIARGVASSGGCGGGSGKGARSSV